MFNRVLAGMRAGIGVAVFGFSGCTMYSTLKKVPVTGQFKGEASLIPIAPNTFLFHQPTEAEQRRGTAPFSFTTHRSSEVVSQKGPGRGKYQHADSTIVPEAMITTGASVPRWLWCFSGLGAWYHPGAGLIHDWLYESHHRIALAEKALTVAIAKQDRAGIEKATRMIHFYGKTAKFDQDDAADVYAEAMRVLMLKNDELLKYIEERPSEETRDLQLLKAEAKSGATRPFIIWAYHWAVSSDGPLGISKRIYKKHTSDMDTFEVVERLAKSGNGTTGKFISKETSRRILQIVKEERKRIAESLVVEAEYRQLANAAKEPRKVVAAKSKELGVVQQKLRTETDAGQLENLIKETNEISTEIRNVKEKQGAFFAAEQQAQAVVEKALK